MAFCTDTDLLFWEPALFRDAAAVGQLLVAGASASVDGTEVTLAGVSLSAARVKPLDVICFSGTDLAGAFPIVSVDSDTSVTISVVYDGLFGSDGSAADPARVGTASGQPCAVRTFYPQRRVVTQLLLEAAGLDVNQADAEDRVLNPGALKRACVLGTLQMIYSALTASADEPAKLQARADLYQRLYRRTMRSARVELDLDGDGRADVVRELGLLNLVRD